MKNLNEEVNKIKHLFNYKKGDVITESLLNEKYDYNKIENLTDPKEIYEVIKGGLSRPKALGASFISSLVGEAPIEAAYMAIEKGGDDLFIKVNEEFLNDDSDEIKQLIKKYCLDCKRGTPLRKKLGFLTGIELLSLVEGSLDIDEVYHKKSIFSMLDQNKWRYLTQGTSNKKTHILDDGKGNFIGEN
jgi:hypothetical protein